MHSLVSEIWNHTTTTVLRPFFRDHPGEPVPEENFWTLWCKGRLTEANLKYEIWKFTNCQSVSQVGSKGMDPVTNETVDCDRICLTTVLHCDLAFNILTKFSFHLWKASYEQKFKDCIIVCGTGYDICSANRCGLGHNEFTTAWSLQWNIWNGCILFCGH